MVNIASTPIFGQFIFEDYTYENEGILKWL